MRICIVVLLVSCALCGTAPAQNKVAPSAEEVLRGLKDFYAKTARDDGSFQNGIDPDYKGMSDSAFSDLAAVTYACTLHKTFGWKLPHEEQTIAFLHSRQKESGEFVNVAGTVDPASPQGKVYNTTQALVALHALGVKPKHDPLGVFEEILKLDYKTLPAYSTSFFPLAYLCAGQPIPKQADAAIRALMIQDDDGYLNNHVAATFHASHYYALVGDPTPKAAQMVARVLRDQRPDGSWFMNQPARDRHATFDAVFTLHHEGGGSDECRQAIDNAAQWALSCRNADGGFGHYPGSTSDADANYFQVGALVMAGVLKMAEPLAKDPELLSWGHAMPVRARPEGKEHLRLKHRGWVSGVAFNADGSHLWTACSDGNLRQWETETGKNVQDVAQTKRPLVSCVAIGKDEELLWAGYDFDPQYWVGREGRSLKKHRGAVLSVAISPDGALLATGGIDGQAILWNAGTGKEKHVLKDHKSWINSLCFNSDGEQLLTGSSDGTVKVWSVAKGELLHTIDATKAEVRSVVISRDGQWLAAGMRYGVVNIWRTKDWSVAHTLEMKTDDVSAVAFMPDSAQLLVGTGDWNRPGRVEVIDVAGGKSVKRLDHPGEVLCVAVSPDGATIAAGGGDHTVSVWKIKKPGN